MEIAFLEKDLKEIKEFLTQEQKEGSLYVAYPTGSRVFKSDLVAFKSSWDVQEFCYENSTDRDRYNYSTIREMHENVDEALKREAYRQVIDKAPIVEDVHENRPFDVLDNLVRKDVAKVHVQVDDKVKDSVNRFELIANKSTDWVYGGGYDQYFVSKHVSLEDAKEALRLSVAADKEKPSIDQLNYMVIGKFPGVWPVFDPTGHPKEGTAVLMQTAIQAYNGKTQTWAYETKDIHSPDDTVKVNVPRFLTVDLDKQNYQLHDKAPDLKPEKGIDLDKTGIKAITNTVSGGLSR